MNRGVGGVVEDVKVRDHVVQGPLLEQGGLFEVAVRKGLQDLGEAVALGPEVGDLLKVGQLVSLRIGLPGRLPVVSPPSKTSSPLTQTFSIPTERTCGSS